LVEGILIVVPFFFLFEFGHPFFKDIKMGLQELKGAVRSYFYWPQSQGLSAE